MVDELAGVNLPGQPRLALHEEAFAPDQRRSALEP